MIQGPEYQAPVVLSPNDIADKTVDAVEKASLRANANKGFPFVRIGIGALVAAVWIAEAVQPDLTERVAMADAESTVFSIQDRFSVQFYDLQKPAWGEAQDRSPGRNDAWADRYGIYNRQVEYIPDGLFRKTAIDDDHIGFFIRVEEFDGDRGKDFDYTNIVLTTPKPEPCPMDVVDNEMVADENCTPLNSPISRGIEYAIGDQGGLAWFGENKSISEDARKDNITAVENRWCELGLVFGSEHPGGPITPANYRTGDFETADFIAPPTIHNDMITGRSTYRGVEQALKTALRLDTFLETTLPLTVENGRPVTLTRDDEAQLGIIMKETGKNIKDMTAQEYADAVAFRMAVLNSEPDTDKNVLMPGATLAIDRAVLANNNNNIDYPQTWDGEYITPENQERYNQNYWCLPDSPDGIKESVRLTEFRRGVGNLAGLQPFATIVPILDDIPQGATAATPNLQQQYPYRLTTMNADEARSAILQFRIQAGLVDASTPLPNVELDPRPRPRGELVPQIMNSDTGEGRG